MRISILPLFILPILLLFLTPGCEEESKDSPEAFQGASSEEIYDAAVLLPEFPADAEVTEPENFDVSGTEVQGTDNVQLPNTDSETSYVAVTIPDSLARETASTVQSVKLWLNDSLATLEFDVASGKVKTGAVATLKDGANYFTVVFESVSGKKYRTPIIMIVRVDDDGNSSNNAVVGVWSAKEFVSSYEGTTSTTYYPVIESDESYYVYMQVYYVFTETELVFYMYHKQEYYNQEDIQAYIEYWGEDPNFEKFTYCPELAARYTFSGNTIGNLEKLNA